MWELEVNWNPKKTCSSDLLERAPCQWVTPWPGFRSSCCLIEKMKGSMKISRLPRVKDYCSLNLDCLLFPPSLQTPQLTYITGAAGVGGYKELYRLVDIDFALLVCRVCRRNFSKWKSTCCKASAAPGAIDSNWCKMSSFPSLSKD